MANREIHTNTFIGGLNMDSDYSSIRNDQYTYAENIRVVSNQGSTFSVLQNIEGLMQLSAQTTIPTNETIIHTNVIRNWGIVITESAGASGVVYNMYRYDFTNSTTAPVVTKFINSKALNIKQPISSVIRWENDDNVKMYFADGVNQMRVVNVDPSHDTYNQTITSDDINMIPSAELPPFEFVGLGTGSLRVGVYQYAYRLFNPRGSETTISPISKLIPIYSQNATSDDETTNRSIKLEVDLNTNLQRAYVYRIEYTDRNSVPSIYLIGDVAIYNDQLLYEDHGGTVLSELSIDEFNALTSYSFIPKVLETKNNILFAANTTENTWDIDYDARAYRVGISGTVKLTSNSEPDLVFNINNLTATTVPKEYDCIAPYNYGDLLYSDNKDGLLGGTGLNVSFQFIKTDLIEDSDVLSNANNYRLIENFNINTQLYNSNSINIYDEDYSLLDSVQLSAVNSRYINYVDTDIDSNLKGYQRDEIYRFGIVLYNEESLPSPVKWIADIRMPHPSYDANKFPIWTSGKQVTLPTQTTDYLSVVTHPLGLRFTVNVPVGVSGYEIVRCDRTLADRTVLTQGIISGITNYYDGNRQTNQLTPFPYLAYSNDHKYRSYNSNNDYTFDMGYRQSPDYFIFISPEICMNKENSADLISRFSTINSIYGLTSPIQSTIGTLGSEKVLANAAGIKQDGRNIIPITSSPDIPYSLVNGFLQGTPRNTIQFGAVDYYAATVAKYYKWDATGMNKVVPVNEAVYANITDTFDYENRNWLTKGTSIGDRVYYNWAWIPENSDGDNASVVTRKIGPHGYAAVIRSNGMTSTIPLLNSSSNVYNTNGVVLCNIKQNTVPYGGDSYAARQNSVYMSIGCYGDNSTQYINCFGGDIYIGILDYANTMLFFQGDDYANGKNSRLFNGAYIPCETSINLSKRADKSIMPSTTYNAGSGYANHFVQNDITQVGDIYTQSIPLYAYNDVYSVSPTVKTYVSESIYSIDNLTTDYRIYSSEVKTNNEITDSWTKFKVADYIDVDSQYGPINKLFTFQNRLYYWQSDAFGTTAVKERALITDNNPGELTLGLGEVLERYDYISVTNGLKPNQLRAVTSSDSTIYWYDDYRHEVVAYNGSIQTLSKIKGIQSYLNTHTAFLSDPVLTYDKKYNEVLINLDTSRILAFNEQLGVCTSFYTFKPDWWFEFSKQHYMFNENKLYQYNAGDTANLLNTTSKVSYIKFIVNPVYSQTKTFDNIQYSGNFSSNNFTNILFETKRQTSQLTTYNQIDYREDTYKFAIPRSNALISDASQLTNMSYEDRMKGKYLVSNYYYNCNNGNTFKVPYINTVYRYSFI